MSTDRNIPSYSANVLLDLARTGVHLKVGPGYAANVRLDLARIVATNGFHAIIDVSGIAASMTLGLARAGGRNLTDKLSLPPESSAPVK